MIRRIFYVVFASVYSSIVFVTLVLCLCLWFFGPLLALGEWRPFDTVFARAMTISILGFLAIFSIILIIFLRRRRNRKMTEDIVSSVDSGPDEDDVVKGELDEMKGKLRLALVMLRKSKLGQKHLYELPWYVM
ncbi:MAG: type VI secretion system membrane subunit TssM, partial [Paracoccaceae bacterium]|nr:type VI secretion system membrane subunit TssM [Paracoccaceae bacterium]